MVDFAGGRVYLSMSRRSKYMWCVDDSDVFDKRIPTSFEKNIFVIKLV